MQARLALLALLLVFALGAAGCDVEPVTSDDGDASSLTQQAADVLRVVDGDTLVVLVAGREERVRYIGIDAPESVAPDQPVECFGPEASAANALHVDGRSVLLEADVVDRDRFGRLLRYVYVQLPGGQQIMVNLQLVEDGYAEARSYPPNERHQNAFQAAEGRAQAAGAGLWGQCRT